MRLYGRSPTIQLILSEPILLATESHCQDKVQIILDNRDEPMGA